MARVQTRGKRHTGYYIGADGRERSAGTSDSKRAALQAARDVEAKIRQGTWINPDLGKITFSDYFETYWLPNRTLEQNSRDTYESHYRAALKPKFGAMALDSIKSSVVLGWVTEQKKAGVTAGTIKARVKALQTVLAARTGVSAMRDGFIGANPCYGVDTPTVPKRKVEIYTPGEVVKLVAALHEWWRVQVDFDSETGLRWGELQGLVVGDVDFLRGIVTIERTIIEMSIAKTGNGTRFMVKEYPKDKEPREVGISRDCAEALAFHVKTRGLSLEDRLFAAPMLKRNPGGRGKRQIISQVHRTETWPNGVPVSRTWFHDEWYAAIKEAGVPMRRPHDLRASHLSWLLAGGADLLTVKERAGHNQVTTTERFLQTMPDKHEKALAALKAVRGY